VNHDQRFGELRSLLHSAPSAALWTALCELLHDWPTPQLGQIAVPYALDHLKAWPDALRACPLDWIKGDPHPALPIARAFDHTTCTDDTLATLARLNPALTSLRARGRITRRGAEALAEWSALPSLRALDLAHTALGDEGATAIVERLGPALRHLLLHQCQIGGAGVLAIVRSPGAANLETLRLDANMAADEGALALAHLPCLPTLRALGLGASSTRSPVTPRALHALAERGVFDALTHLHLSGATIASAHASALASARDARWRMIDLSGCQLPPEGLRALLDAPVGAHLAELRLSTNPLGEQGALLLAQHDAPREVVDLSHQDLSGVGLRALVGAPWIASLRALGLAGTDLDADDARAIHEADGLDLRTLDMTYTQLGDDGAYWLARAPGLASLRALRMVHCGIGTRGARAIASAAWGDTLETLTLHDNPIDAEALAALASARLPALRHLGLEGIQIDAHGAAALLRAPWLAQLDTLALDTHELSLSALRLLIDEPSLPERLRARLLGRGLR
jgi:Ran GTPase-activating protein (RanGAP) involved in mRNA processing and transport